MTPTHPYRFGARWLGISLLVAGNILRAGVLGAQEAAVPAPPHHVGPVTLAPVIALHDVGIDSNVYNNAKQPVSDLTFTVVPTVNATARVRRATLSAQSDTQFVYFTHQASERSINQALSGTAQVALRRITVVGTSGYVNTRERPSEEIDARSRRIERNAQADLRLRLFPKLLVGMTGRATRTDYDADAAYEGVLLNAQLNHGTRALGGSARYVLTPLTALVVTMEAARNRFSTATFRDSDSRQFLAGVELQARALVAGSAMLGRQQFTARSAGMPSFAGLVGSGNLSIQVRPATVVGVVYDRNIYYSYSDLAPYYVRAGFGVSVRRTWSSRWNLQGTTGRYTHRYRYLDRPLINDVVFDADETVAEAAVGAGYQVRRGMQFVVTLGYRNRQATSTTRGYDSLRLGTSVVYGF